VPCVGQLEAVIRDTLPAALLNSAPHNTPALQMKKRIKDQSQKPRTHSDLFADQNTLDKFATHLLVPPLNQIAKYFLHHFSAFVKYLVVELKMNKQNNFIEISFFGKIGSQL